MATACFCGCGREVPFGRRRAANAIGAVVEEHLALLRGALERGAAPDHAHEMEGLLAGGEPLRDQLSGLVHGTIDRRDYDKAAARAWLRDAGGVRKRLADDAIAAGYVGWNAVEQAQLVSAGRAAPATLLEVADTGMSVNDNPRVRLRLRIEPQGEPPFEVERKVTVSRVAVPRAGERVEVFYDPDDRERFTFRVGALDDDASASPDVAEQLVRLAGLHASGALSDAEFAEAKRRVIHDARGTRD
jgi:hypothetical protein